YGPPGPIRCHARSCRAASARDWCSSAGSTTRRCGGNGNPCRTRGGGQCCGGRSAAGGESAKTGREQSDKTHRGSDARGASAPRRKDGPRPPNSRNGGGAASLSIWAVDLCAADLFATNLHVAGWHRPGFPPRQAGANQAAQSNPSAATADLNG